MPSPSSFMTFSRRKKVVRSVDADVPEHPKRAESALEVQANGVGPPQGELIRSGPPASNLTSWQRKTTHTAHIAENQNYITELRTYFKEIDAFELRVEEEDCASVEPKPSAERQRLAGGQKDAVGDSTDSAKGEPAACPKIAATPKSMAGRIFTGLADAFQRLGIRNYSRPASVGGMAKHSEVSTPSKVCLPLASPEKLAQSTVRKGIITRYQEALETNDQSDSSGEVSLRLQNDLQVSGALVSQVQEISTRSKLDELLALCGQQGCGSTLPSMEGLLGDHVDISNVRKIGEGTFGEAFKVGNVVFKIVPMEGEALINGEPQKRAQEISAEVAITLTLSNLRSNESGNVTSGFVKTFGIGLCRGPYAPTLCAEWHNWDDQFHSENEAVDNFNSSQQYVVFMAADGGIDLEHFEVRSFAELRSVLLQSVLTLAVAEEACQFEHRDLHWGNILIRRNDALTADYTLRGSNISANVHGLNVTLIDFTLSRLITENGDVAYCDLATDPGLFNGPKGNFQAEAYRRMKKATKNSWEASFPVTNCLWMRYLGDILMKEKMGDRLTMDDKMELRGFSKRAMGYASCKDMLWDDFFKGHWAVQQSSEIKN